MKKAHGDRILVRFSTPDPKTNIIKVSKVLPNDTEKSVGQIYPYFEDGEDSIKYISVDNRGQELFPLSSDFTEIENQFEKFIKELDEREKVIKSIRQLKSKFQSRIVNR